jgi:hypothetical protein
LPRFSEHCAQAAHIVAGHQDWREPFKIGCNTVDHSAWQISPRHSLRRLFVISMIGHDTPHL